MTLPTTSSTSSILLSLKKNLTQLRDELPKPTDEAVPDEAAIDQIRQNVFSQVNTAFQTLGSTVPLLSLEDGTTHYVSSAFPDSTLRARIKGFQTILLIRSVLNQINGLLITTFDQEDRTAFDRIDNLFTEVRGLIQSDAEKMSKLLKDQENLTAQSERLKQQETELQSFQQRCEGLRQTFGSMGARIQLVDSDMNQMRSHIEEDKAAIDIQSATVVQIMGELSTHLQQLSTLETELQVQDNEEDLHAQEVAGTSEAVSLLSGEVREHVQRVSAVREGLLRLQASLSEMQNAAAAASAASNRLVLSQSGNSVEGGVPPTATLSDINRSSLVVRLFVWVFKALYWIKEACDHTSDLLSKALNRISSSLQPKLSYCLGEKKASIITHPSLWMTTLFFILLWKGRLRKGMVLYVVVSAVFHLAVNKREL